MAEQTQTQYLTKDGLSNGVMWVTETSNLGVNTSIILGSKTILPVLVNILAILDQNRIIVGDASNVPLNISKFIIKDKAYIKFNSTPEVIPTPSFTSIPITAIPANSITLNCDLSVKIGQLIYIDSISDTAKVADNTSEDTTPALGVVVSKPSGLTCIIQLSGEITVFSDLSVGNLYYLANNGNITNTPPSAPNCIVQRVGVAITPDILFLTIDPSVTIL